MSLSEIRNVVLLFSNPVWNGGNTVPSTIVRNITAYSSQVAYEERIGTNITTLTTTNARTLNGVIQGLLYVPEIRYDEACDEQQYDFIPRNATRRQNLPPTNYNLIAIAPWFRIDCTLAYLASARLDPIRAFIFYKPNNSTHKPQDVDSPVWNLDDGGAWKTLNQFPIFAIPGMDGQNIVNQLSRYSGNLTSVPYGDEIQEIYGPNPRDYVRVWTELTMVDDRSVPPMWVFILIVIGALLIIIGAVSFTMHWIQRKHRASLQRRVRSGEVDLEAMGIQRLTVPQSHIKSLPLYTYQFEPDIAAPPHTPSSINGLPVTPRSVKSSRRRRDQRSVVSDIQSVGSLRSKRSSIASTVDTTATNFQPKCHICLTNFEHRVTIIRQLPCGHIFHPECIDEFLAQVSSLCPICKQCMLPPDYSPKITNSMVRRERALRRLRERVDLDDSSLESGDGKSFWKRHFFKLRSRSDSYETREVPMTPVSTKAPRDATHPSPAPAPSTPGPENSSAATTPAATDGPPETSVPPPASVRAPRPRKPRPRALNLLPTQPEEGEAKYSPKQGRKSPSSFARQRMRDIAAKNAPIDDPDHQRPPWRRAVNKVFPGFL